MRLGCAFFFASRSLFSFNFEVTNTRSHTDTLDSNACGAVRRDSVAALSLTSMATRWSWRVFFLPLLLAFLSSSFLTLAIVYVCVRARVYVKQRKKEAVNEMLLETGDECVSAVRANARSGRPFSCSFARLRGIERHQRADGRGTRCALRDACVTHRIELFKMICFIVAHLLLLSFGSLILHSPRLGLLRCAYLFPPTSVILPTGLSWNQRNQAGLLTKGVPFNIWSIGNVV